VFRSLRTTRFSPSASVSEENAFRPLSPLHSHALFSAITQLRDHSPAMKFISIPFDFVIDRNREERATDLDADAGLAPMPPLSVVSNGIARSQSDPLRNWAVLLLRSRKLLLGSE